MAAAATPPCQQFNLRWNNHTTNFVNVFLEQYSTQNLVDVTLTCQGQFLKAHKMVLSACSPYFQELFQVHNVPNPVIIMNQMQFKDVKLIIEFMYRGEIKVLEEDIDGILEVAETLQVKGLCNVRNKYEKGDIQTNENDEGQQNKENTSLSSDAESKHRKKRKMSHTVNELANESVLSEPRTNGNVKPTKLDDDLPTEIKIEPPDIKDIDDESPNDWESSRLMIEEPEVSRPRILKRKKVSGNKGSSSKPSTSSDGVKYSVTTTKSSKSVVVNDMKGGKIPRPPNAFMIFANEWRRRLATENPRESNKDISVRLGVLWKNLGADMKETYYQQARDADKEHKLKYPGYYYSPKEARLRKNQRDFMMMMTKNRHQKSVDAMRLVKDEQIDNDGDDEDVIVDMDNADYMDGDDDSDKQEMDVEKSDKMADQQDNDDDMDDD